MFSDLGDIRSQLKDRLEPLLPDAYGSYDSTDPDRGGWRIVDELSAAVDATVPVLYFEYIEIVSAVDGQPLPRSTVGARIDLSIASAGKGDEDAADRLVLTLVHALQQFSDIFWDTATKTVLTNGSVGWRIPLTVLSTKE